MNRQILIIVQHFYGGGAERVAADVANELGKNNDVLVVTFDNTHEAAYKYQGKKICLKLFTPNILFKPFIILLRIIKIKKIKKKYNIEFAISFLRNANIVNIFSRSKEKVIVSVRTNIGASTNKMQQFAERYICNQADKVISLSEGVKNDLVNVLAVDSNKIKTIYNMCDTKKLFQGFVDRTLEEKLLFKIKGKYCIFACGSFRYPKGHWHLIKTFKIVHEKFPNTILIIFGEGEYKNRLVDLIQKFDLSDHVIMPGYVSNFHILMKKFGKIFCFTSLYEGFGNVLLEAMAAESAIVSADCEFGPGEILMGKCKTCNDFCITNYGILTPGFPIEPADFSTKLIKEEEVMAMAIIYLIKNEKERKNLIKNSLIRLEAFKPERIAEEWENIFNII